MSQNSSTSSSNARRYLSGFLLGTLLLLLPGVMLSFYLQPLSGELTRIGHLAERDFGPNRPQAGLTRNANDTPATAADVLVLGDSFSDKNAWQTTFAAASGLKTLTYHYDDTPCLDYWLTQAASGKLSGHAKVIIIESVERNFIRRFTDEAAPCAAAPLPPRPAAAETLSGQRSHLDLFPMNIAHLLKTLSNHSAPDNRTGRTLFQRTAMVSLTRADLFSSKRSGQLLYYAVDDERRQQFWSPERASRALAYLTRYRDMAAAHGIRLMVVVIPDKSAVYAPWVRQGQLPDVPGYALYPRIADTLGEDADLLTRFRAEAERRIDFYAPNDTHLSLDGFRYLGELLATQLQ